MNNIKTSFYDFFGYFIPGLLFVIVVSAECFIANGISLTQMTDYIKDINVFFAFVFIVIVYFLGHLLSACSSYLFEKLFMNKSNMINNIMNDFSKKKVSEIFSKKFGHDFNNDSRLLVCFAEEYMPKAYSTALVFLSIYGMARNSSLVFIVASVLRPVLMLSKWTIQYWYIELIYIVISVLLYHQYSRFYKYFTRHIINSFILSYYKGE